MVDRVGGGSGSTRLSNKPDKTSRQKSGSKPTDKIGIQLESQLRILLKESGINKGQSELLVSRLVDVVLAEKQINFEDKERILLAVNEKVSKHSQLIAVFDNLLKHLKSTENL